MGTLAFRGDIFSHFVRNATRHLLFGFVMFFGFFRVNSFFPGDTIWPLQWRHNGRDSVSNHQSCEYLLSRLIMRRSKNTSKLRVTGLCAGNSPVTGEFPAQRASKAENVSIWWRHHAIKTSRTLADGTNPLHENLFWLFINGIPWHSPVTNFTGNAQGIGLCIIYLKKNTLLKVLLHLSMTNVFKYQLIEILSWKYWNVIMKYATMNYLMSVICTKKTWSHMLVNTMVSNPSATSVIKGIGLLS